MGDEELVATFAANAIGTALANSRKQANLTQDQVAEQTGLRRETVGRIERGLQSPNVDTVEKIASALGLHMEINFSRKT